MNRFWRFMANVAAALAGLGFCASCPKHNVQPVYGVPIATKYGPPPIALQLEVKSFSFTPASPVHVGDTLTFKVELASASHEQAEITVVGEEHSFSVKLHDDGVAPDADAGDNVYCGSAPWLPKYGAGKLRLLLIAHYAQERWSGQSSAELPLEVLPKK